MHPCLLVACAFLVCNASTRDNHQVPQWKTDRVHRIGSVNDSRDALTTVGQVLIAANGTLLVSQPDERIIRTFNADGRFNRIIGATGQGPGEFQALTAIGILGDSIYAADAALRRVTFFSADGKLLNTIPWSSPNFQRNPVQYMATVPTLLLRDGSALVQPRMAMSIGPGAPPVPVTRVPFLRLSRRGEVLDTVAWQVFGPNSRAQAIVIESVGGRRVAINPFETQTLFILSTDGSGIIVVERPMIRDSDPSRYTIRKITPSGDTLFSRTNQDPRAAMSTAAIRYAVDAVLRQLAAQPLRGGVRMDPPTPGEIERALKTGGYIPKYQISVVHAVSAQDGGIWLKREYTRNDIANWDVLDAQGNLRARVELPASQNVVAVSGDVLIVTETSALDVPYIVRYQLRK